MLCTAQHCADCSCSPALCGKGKAVEQAGTSKQIHTAHDARGVLWLGAIHLLDHHHHEGVFCDLVLCQRGLVLQNLQRGWHLRPLPDATNEPQSTLAILCCAVGQCCQHQEAELYATAKCVAACGAWGRLAGSYLALKDEHLVGYRVSCALVLLNLGLQISDLGGQSHENQRSM